MAPPKRTFFVMLVSVSGFLYFLYTAYTSSLDGPLYRFTPWNKALGNMTYPSSSLRAKKKEEQVANIYSVLNSISDRSNNSIFSVNEIVKNKTMDEKNETSKASSIGAPVVKKNNNNNIIDKNNNKNKNNSNKNNSNNNNNNNNNKKDNLPPPPPPPPPPDSKSSVIQRIPPKVENVTVDYIVQGVATHSLYDSGFRVPNVELCPDLGNNLKLVIIITSAPGHVEARKAIRQTWGHFQLRTDVAIAFILGRSPDGNETLVRNENTLYGDVILANFVDSYNNLTLKTTSILEWVDNFCHRAKFVLKTDDDMFINIPKLLDFVDKHWKDERKIFGKLARKWKPIRKKTSKYYVSVQQYKHPVFPDFTTGPAYLMTSDVIHDLFSTALEMTYLKLEDVYTTGIVAQENNVQRIHVPEFLNRRLSITSCNVQKAISIHMIKPFEQYDLWKRLLDGRTKC